MCMCVRASACAHVCVCVRLHLHLRVHVYKCRNTGLSGTGMKKSNDAGTYPVPDKADAFWHFFGLVPD